MQALRARHLFAFLVVTEIPLHSAFELLFLKKPPIRSEYLPENFPDIFKGFNTEVNRNAILVKISQKRRLKSKTIHNSKLLPNNQPGSISLTFV